MRSSPFATSATASALALLVGATLVACLERPTEAPGTASPATPATRSAAGAPRPDEHVPCRDRDPRGQAFFGELHVHTARSFDAYPMDVRVTPDEAYAFARGEPVGLPPWNAAGAATRRLRIDRPLDFAAVTDHAEMFGEMRLCTEPGSRQYDTPACRTYRGERPVPGMEAQPNLARVFAFMPLRRAPDFCGEDLRDCDRASRSVWREIQAAAERAYDRSDACRFTSFVAYEYSLVADGNSIHRNVVFANAIVPQRPTSAAEAPRPHQLWTALERDCLDAGTGCDALAIPHNSNLSGGEVFALAGPEVGPDEARARARARARVERLAEVFQAKGDSECRNGLFEVLGGADEACGFEKVRPTDAPVEDCGLGLGRDGFSTEGCVSRLNFVRYALLEGLRQSERLGINALRLGIVAATDQHLGTAGAVSESRYPGAMGTPDASPLLRLGEREKLEGAPARAFPIRNNPGGLAGVWAPENTREALFAAMKRRETFGTSGPRIAPRLFAGHELPEDLCEGPDFVERGRALGVPMGATLEERAPAGRAASPLRFAVSAEADPATPADGLERIQIVKGWVDDAGRMHQRVHDVAVAPDAEAPPRTRCGSPEPRGSRSLCATWTDPAPDPTRPAVYYARVLQAPTCRWSTWQCETLDPGERPSACEDATIPRTIRERAWTSPIWIEPGDAGA